MFFTLLNPSLITLPLQTVFGGNSYNCFLVALLLAEGNLSSFPGVGSLSWELPGTDVPLVPTQRGRGQAAVALQRCRALSHPGLLDLHLADGGSNVEVSSTGKFQIAQS